MVRKELFGKTKKNETAYRYILENNKGMQVTVSDFGALILSVYVLDCYVKLMDKK